MSIPANIAEGNSRFSTPAYLNHINVALGSHGELRALVEIAFRLGFIESKQWKLKSQPGSMKSADCCAGLRKALKRRCSAPAHDPDPNP